MSTFNITILLCLSHVLESLYVVFGNKYFNYEIINEEFENDKIWIVIIKFLTLTTLKTMVEFDPNPNLKNLWFTKQ